MNQNIFAFAMLLLFLGSAFAGTTVSVGEAVPAGGTTVTTTNTTAEAETAEGDSGEEEGGSTIGGMVMTNEEGDSVVVGKEEGTLEVVEDAPAQNGEVQAPQLVQAQVQSHSGKTVQAQVMEQEQEMLLVANGASASTDEELIVQEQKVYLEQNGNQYHVVMMPYELQYAGDGDAEVQGVKLEVYEQTPAYRFRVKEKRSVLWVLPVDSETEYVVDAQSGKVLEENAPWWGFLAPPTHNFKGYIESAGETS